MSIPRDYYNLMMKRGRRPTCFCHTNRPFLVYLPQYDVLQFHLSSLLFSFFFRLFRKKIRLINNEERSGPFKFRDAICFRESIVFVPHKSKMLMRLRCLHYRTRKIPQGVRFCDQITPTFRSAFSPSMMHNLQKI